MLDKETLYRQIGDRYAELEAAIDGDDIGAIRERALEVHALVHPAEVSGRQEKTLADYVFDCLRRGHQNDPVPRQPWEVDLHYSRKAEGI